jgi:zona occludens toxin
MAIKVATGLQGHGKTYETVLHAICPAIKQGRRVVTNVAGLDYEKIVAYVSPDEAPAGAPVPAGTGVQAPKVGVIVSVTRTQIRADDFFPRLDEGGHYDPGFESLVLPGDLVVLDEAWAIWGDTKAVKPTDMAFLREHRHFTHMESGVTCDLILITQDIADLARSVRNVVEMTTLCYKPKEIGITSAYVVDLYQGAKLHRTRRISTHRYFYKPAVFELYSSYSGKKAKEVGVDARQNMFASAGLRLKLGLAVLVLIGSGWWVIRFLSPERVAGPSVDSAAQAPTEADSVPVPIAQAPVSSPFVSSSKSRNVGFVRIGERIVFVIETDAGRYRYRENPESFMVNVHTSNIQLEGETLTSWQGGRSGGGGGLFGGVTK